MNGEILADRDAEAEEDCGYGENGQGQLNCGQFIGVIQAWLDSTEEFH